MDSVYTFTLAAVNTTVLAAAIQANADLGPTFDYIEALEDPDTTWTVNIYFTSALSDSFQTELTTLVNNYETSAPLQIAQAAAIANLQIALESYLDAAYPFLLRQQLVNLYFLANIQGMTNRAAYLLPGLNWANSIAQYGLSIMGQIQSATTPSQVAAITWNIAANVLATPTLTLAGAFSISN